LTISIRDPWAAWVYEIVIFVAAAIAVASVPHVPRVPLTSAIPLAAISLWGAVQAVFGATVYGYATLDAALRFGAFGATAIAAFAVFSRARFRDGMLEFLAKFGFAMAVLAVVSHYTSGAKVLWIFPSPYPDAWGPFLSRNNFAQFLELALPVAMWKARRGATPAVAMAGAMLAAGFASASRAGAILLVAETLACLWMLRRGWPRAARWTLAAAVAAFSTIAGWSELRSRLLQPDPFEFRREFTRSTVAMIRDHPARGFGLGTFQTVYPAYAEFDAGAAVDHAHNDWLEWASEGGIGFAAVWVALALALVGPAIRSVWGIGVIAVFLHALVDYPFARFGITAWFFVLAGALAAIEAERIVGERSRSPRPLTSEAAWASAPPVWRTKLRRFAARSVAALACGVAYRKVAHKL
jgi:O-antigen ligase